MSDEHSLKTSISSIFANLLMKKPDNSFAIVKNVKKTPEIKTFYLTFYCIFT